MGKRKVSILEPAAEAVADIALQRHVPNCKIFLVYRCVAYKKYVVAYLSRQNEIIICDFVASKLIK